MNRRDILKNPLILGVDITSFYQSDNYYEMSNTTGLHTPDNACIGLKLWWEVFIIPELFSVHIGEIIVPKYYLMIKIYYDSITLLCQWIFVLNITNLKILTPSPRII
jgi:hypothetical protein